jgi:hypothetical protein
VLGRWQTRDPIGYADGMGLYQYAGSTPITLGDLFGLETIAQWSRIARRNAGIEDGSWVPWAGFTPEMREVTRRVYGYYGRLYQENPDHFLWAGLASIGGQTVQGVLGESQDMLQDPPLWFSLVGPLGAQTHVMVRQSLTLQMGKDVFDDLAWQMEAYKAKGIGEFLRLFEDGLITRDILNIWCAIDRGDVAAGNWAMLRREQSNILQRYYDDFTWYDDWFANKHATIQLPNVQSFSSLLPNGDLSKYSDRWLWMGGHVFANWADLSSTARSKLVQSAMDHDWSTTSSGG